MSNNEKLIETILGMVENFADTDDEIAGCQLNLAMNFLQPWVRDTLKEKWNIIEDNDLYEGYEIIPLIYGTLEKSC